MKCFYDIKLETAKDEKTGLIGYTNRHKFQLKTTGFNIITSTDWVSLGGMANKVALKDNLNNLAMKMPIESEFSSVIKIDFTANNAVIGSFSILNDYDALALKDLDGKTLASMDVKIMSEEG